MVTRLLKHLSWPKIRLLAAFPAADLNRIEDAVGAAEQGHTAEIRVIIESAFPIATVLRDATARSRAAELFVSEPARNTRSATVILVYVLMAECSVEILCDEASKIPADVLEEWARTFSSVAADSVGSALVEIVTRIGAYCRAHFPGEDSVNELPDRPTLR